MTTIIERPTTTESDGGSGVAALGIIVGAIAAAVIAMVAYNGGFNSTPATNDTNLTITTPAAPEAAPKEAQPAPQPVPEPSPAPVQ